MSQSSNNLDPKEATEAKLCAYLEGELDPADRAEIEKYLQSNPQHRQLLTELAQTRELLSSLPRESAPPEIAEAFEGQLERSMLLDSSAGSESIVRINRWPQVVLVAAMFVVAAALGTVIYFALPGSSLAPPKYSVATMPSVAPVPDRVVEAAPQSAPGMPTPGPVALNAPASPEKEAFGAKKQSELPAPAEETRPLNFDVAKGEVAQLDQATKPTALPAEVPIITGPTVLPSAAPAMQQMAAASSLTNGSDQSGVNNNSALYLLVRTNDPSAASEQVRRYLVSNQIRYDTVSGNNINSNYYYNDDKAGSIAAASGRAGGGAGMGGSGNGGDGAMRAIAAPSQKESNNAQLLGSPLGARIITLRRGSGDLASLLQKSSDNRNNSIRALKQKLDVGTAPPATSQMVPAEIANRRPEDSALSPAVAQAMPQRAIDSNSAPPATQNSFFLNDSSALNDRRRSQDQGALAVSPTTGETAQDELAVDTSNGDMFVARGVSPRDAEQLHAALAAQSVSQTAEMYTVAHADESLAVNKLPAAASGMSPLVIAAGAANNTATDSPGPGSTTAPSSTSADQIQPNDRLKVTIDQLVGPGVDKTSTVRVADDGTIALPMIEPLRVQGQTPAAAQKQIADKYREANLIPSATVSVTRDAIPTTIPSTQPSVIAGEPPPTAALPQSGNTTQPAASTEPSSPEKIDVVILVQKSFPTTGPASQPAAESPVKQ